MCWHVPTCDIIFGPYDTNELDLICMLTYVSTCGHADMCWYVPTCADMCHVLICADMCRYVPTCVDMCQHITLASLSAPLIPTIWTLSACCYVSARVDMPTCADMCQHVASLSAFLIQTIWALSPCWHVSAHVDMPTCAGMCRYVSTYNTSITLGTSDTNHLDLVCMLLCVSTCGHADMCQHVASLSAFLIQTIWALSPRCHVSAHMDMPTCADMSRHVLTCADMWHHFWPIWYQWVGSYLHADICQHMWTCWYVPTCADMCRHVLICADMCRYVPTCNVSITISTPDSNQLDLICTWQVSAHVEMPACADMCRHVLIYADMCQYVTSLWAPIIPIIWTWSAFQYV